MTVGEAKFRFAQYGILQAVADSRTLSRVLAFKGGNALDFVWQPNRSTKDLDFSSKDPTLTAEQIRTSLTPSLERVSRSMGVLYRVQKMEQQPPGPDRSFITFEGTIGYALPDDRRNRQLIQQDKTSNATVPLDVSLNEPICRVVEVDIASSTPLQVCQLEDIVAEKLRALLQQPLRNRRRPQDVLDICIAVQENLALDLNLTAEFLLEKAMARNVPVSRAAFHQEEIRRRAFEGYNELRETTRRAFIEFEEAFAIVLSLVDGLPLPAR
ncbi:MAG: nucleotidyl transferase AbiEii/AbiGii toxin family protein [Bryobacteraceae bacterium]|jgi:predicted nucleotidyltransferase component of viral defense system